jgi:hypothetical protein
VGRLAPMAADPLDLRIQTGDLARLGSPPTAVVDDSVRRVIEAVQRSHTTVEAKARGELAVEVIEKRPVVGWHRATEAADWAISQLRGQNVVAREQLELRLREAMLLPDAADRTRSVDRLLAVELQRLTAEADTLRTRALHGAQQALARSAG